MSSVDIIPLRAGLPQSPNVHAPLLPSDFIEIQSLNYDYLPMALETPKQFWADLRFSPPSNLKVGTFIRLHINSIGMGIKTEENPSSPNNSLFQLGDIIGSRVILLPIRSSKWLPTFYSCDHMGWGYNTLLKNTHKLYHHTKYGYGESTYNNVPMAMGYIEYHPQFY